MKTHALLSLAIGLVAATASAEDWPQWRGPERNGISRETGLLPSWPQGGPKLVWQIQDAGDGYSTPSVARERLYLMGNKGMDDEFVQARSTTDGQLIWSTHIGKVGPNRGPQYPGARSTPTLDGDVLYALGSDGDLACLETASGKIRWQKNLRIDFGGKTGSWAYAESPLVDGDALVCTPGGSEATIIALEKTTGDVLWKSALPEGDEAGYASPIVVTVGGIKQYVQFLQKGLVGVDAKTGELLWRYGKTAERSPANIPTPIAHDGFVYNAAGRSGGALVKLTAKAGRVTAEEVYFSPQLPTAIGGAVLLKGFLYGTNSQGLVCADFASGDRKWQERGIGAGSVCFADGRLYVHGENGDLALIEPNSEEYREHGRFTPEGQPDRGRSMAWTYPVVANGRLYVRDLGVLWSYDIRAVSENR